MCPRGAMQRKGCIVVVETDDLIRDLLERWLSEAGYTVLTTGADTPLPEHSPSLVIVNVSRPGHSGTLIRSLQAAYPAPILVISGRFRRGLSASANAARQLGATKVLPKPFTRAELLAAVRESIEEP
jgi:DNA-binding response OmpR family regulator